jgi:DHA2 family multidrug resistance protein
VALREAQIMTVNDLFHLLGLLFFASLLLMPLVSKVRHDAGDTAAH